MFDFVRQYCKISMQKSLIGICQMSVGNSKVQNFVQAKLLVEECKRLGAAMAFLPEACDYIADKPEESIEMSEDVSSMNDSLLGQYSNLAKTNEIWLSLGGLHRRCATDPYGKIRNTHVILDQNGNMQGCYDKCHLFNVDIPDKVVLKETDITVPGKTISDPVTTPVGNIGLMICYDIRFPQISTTLRERGAEILTYPSAFTVPTGHAHWEVLLRARAIENQCYIVAAAQVGNHNAKRVSFGHSMVVDPWGKVIACNADKIGVITAEIDLDYLKKIRTNMPVFNHTRPDIY
ncbi:unnamed protein product [Clavelina lepadiformis]|uniref:CN hydrolase domain-containing protein n=1 Tax=Clavelina lepadiformis TaxID=159417 RepID=A0ABP0GGB8_CLALP